MPRTRASARAYHQRAQRQLRRFRQGSVLAVAITALVLLVWGAPLEVEGAGSQSSTAPAPAAGATAAVGDATQTLRDLAVRFYGFLPRLLLVLALFALAVLVARLLRALLERTLGTWPRATAVMAVTRIGVYTVTAIAALSIVAGDARAVLGSVGLLGLAASWALQTPIESFTGWLLNSFRGYYRVGDRISVGDVFGDVYRIDVLTTTVWEAGGPGKAVDAAQSTGALITFPNWEVVRSNIVNYSRDFPYVWDEIAIAIANESDLAYSAGVLRDVARRALGGQMAEAVERYQALLRSEHLLFDVEEVPEVYLSGADAWTVCTIRYLVPVRSRRRWSSDLTLATSVELARPEHRDRIIPVYPRQEVLVRRQWPEAHEAKPPA